MGARKVFVRRWRGREVTLPPYLGVLNGLNPSNALFALPRESGLSSSAQLDFTPQLPLFPTAGLEWTS